MGKLCAGTGQPCFPLSTLVSSLFGEKGSWFLERGNRLLCKTRRTARNGPRATPFLWQHRPTPPALNMAAAPPSCRSAHAPNGRGVSCRSVLRSPPSYWALTPANRQRLLPGGGGGAWRAEGTARQSARGVAGAEGGAALEPGAPRRRHRRHRPRLALSPPARPCSARSSSRPSAPQGRGPVPLRVGAAVGSRSAAPALPSCRLR